MVFKPLAGKPMSELKHEDRIALLRVLESLPLLQSNRGRRQLLEFSGLQKIIPQLDLDGSPFIVLGEMVAALEQYGRVDYGYEALGLFINSLKEFVGGAAEQNMLFDKLLQNYQLMIPTRGQRTKSDWRFDAPDRATVERIIGENTLRHISFLEAGLRAAHSVCLIDTGKWTGTGFLISHNLLMTNEHVLPSVETALSSCFRFNYQLAMDGSEQHPSIYKASEKPLFLSNKELDYAIVEISGAPGHDWGICTLNACVPQSGTRVNIIQHPAGLPKQISLQNNQIQYSDQDVIQYLTSTFGGSSGSPVFDDNWTVIAVHHAGGLLVEPGSKLIFMRNEGVSVGRILRDIEPELRSKLSIK